MPFEEVHIENKDGKQRIQIPEKLKMEGSKVYLKKGGDVIYVIPFEKPWHGLIESLGEFSEDFMDKRQQPPIKS